LLLLALAVGGARVARVLVVIVGHGNVGQLTKSVQEEVRHAFALLSCVCVVLIEDVVLFLIFHGTKMRKKSKTLVL
jgi:hypothetical protein